MKKILNTIFLATFLFAAACSDGYDDTRIKKDLDDVGQILDELEQAVDGLRTQMDALTQLINSSFVSLISTDAEGNYVITYIDRGGESRTLTLATQKEVVTLPIVGIAKDEDGVWYWRQTSDNGETYEWILVDGEKVPAGGEKPEVGIDAEGFWTVNGKPITDAKGNKVLANDVSNIRLTWTKRPAKPSSFSPTAPNCACRCLRRCPFRSTRRPTRPFRTMPRK